MVGILKRKRTFVALLLTAIILFITNSLYLVVKPFPVMVGVSGDNLIEIEAQIATESDKKFKYASKKRKQINIKRDKEFRISFKKILKQRRMQLILSNLEENKPIYLNSLKIKHKEYKLDKFKAKDALLEMKNDKLKIIPRTNKVKLVYSDKINVRSSVSFEVEVFISLLILYFLLFYKLTDYLADFKSIQSQSRIDIVFLSIFFFLLFVPMSKINDANISKQENRQLAKWESLVKKDGSINMKFGNNFNNWFNDRFNFRSMLVAFNTDINVFFNNVYISRNGTYDKKHKLIYSGSFWGLEDVDDEKLAQYAENMLWLQSYCDKRNIKLYVLIVPRGIDFVEHTIINKKREKTDNAQTLVDYLRENTNINVVFPRERMLEENKNTPMYFKTDHHWTKRGAYIGYEYLINEIQKDFSNVELLQEAELEKYHNNKVSAWWNAPFYEGRTFQLLGFSKKSAKNILTTPYLYYKNPKRKDLDWDVLYLAKDAKTKSQDEKFYYPYGADYKVMVIGNSFARNLVEFLPYSFKHTIRMYDNFRGFDMNIYSEVIEEYKPNILILNFQSSYSKNLLNIKKHIGEQE